MSSESPISSVPSGGSTTPSAASLAAAGYTNNARFSVPDLFPDSPISSVSSVASSRTRASAPMTPVSSGPTAPASPSSQSEAEVDTSADSAGSAVLSETAVDSGVNAAQPLPQRALDTTPENPWPVGYVAHVFTNAINKWPPLWMIGQIVEINVRRRGSAYITLHDDSQDISMQVVAFGQVALKAREFKQGDQILVHGQASVWVKQTRFSFRADQIRAVGRGQLIEQINELRRKLKGEGLFDEDRKKPLPQFPSKIGIICGPGARAESDIIRNAQLRWPTIEFVVEPAAVQGIHCPPEVIAALKKLDSRDDIDVIIVARGGGSFEDLIGFSDEGVVRQIAACRHPVVTAIGHEADWTLADQAADLRASTPTDAAKRVVPDVMEQTQLIADQRSQMNATLEALVTNEQRLLDGYRTRPIFTEPEHLLDEPLRLISQAQQRLDMAIRLQIDDENLHLEKRLSSLEALSPLRTLQRGYAIVQNANGTVVTSADSLSRGDQLTLRLRAGEAHATVTSIEKSTESSTKSSTKESA